MASIWTQAMKLHKNFDHFKYSLCVNTRNILGEYSSFFEPHMWNYLQLNWINLHQNDFVSKQPVTITTVLAFVALTSTVNL